MKSTRKNTDPSISFFQTCWYVYLPIGNRKYKRQFVTSGTPDQRAEYARGIKPVPTNEQKQAYRETLTKWEKQQAGERMTDSREQTTVETLASKYIKIKSAEGLSDSRKTGIRHIVGMFSERFGNLEISQVTPALVRDFVDDQASWRTGNSQNTAIGVLKSLFNWAVYEGIIPVTPIRPRSLPCRQTDERRDYLITAKDEKTIAENTSKAFNAFWRFCLLTGCRPGEACRMTAADVVEQQGCLSIVLKQHKTAKKTGKPRVIEIIGDECERIVRDAMAANPDGTLFRNKWGKPMKRQAWIATIRRLQIGGFLPKTFSMYSARHAFVTRALIAGIPAMHVAELVGNSVRILEKHYAHLCNARSAIRAHFLKLSGV